MSHKHLSSLPESHEAADTWHQHSPEEHPQVAHGENLAVGTVLLYGTASFVLVVVSVVATIVYFYWYVEQYKIERVEHYDVAVTATPDQQIQSEYNKLRQQSDEVLKGLRGDGGAIEKTIARYSQSAQPR
jgi:hypothetical protein